MNAHTQVEARAAERNPDNPVAIIPPVDSVEDEMGFTLIADLPGVSGAR